MEKKNALREKLLLKNKLSFQVSSPELKNYAMNDLFCGVLTAITARTLARLKNGKWLKNDSDIIN